MRDQPFLVFCAALLFMPALAAAWHWDWPWLLLYLPVLLVFAF